ncbi:GMC oxidoreductase [Candidatus Pelagibacter sp.]|nr:GMC oxidoreductase [Candidatus Pelagibacter sp.]
MFKDLKNFPSNSILRYDICIVGTGPAGLSVAKQLLGTDLKIVILESGGLEPEPEYQELNEGINSGPSYLSLDGSRLRCFGGAGKVWAGHCGPFKSDEFDKKSYVPLSGWPISYDDLKIYYKQAAEMLGISYEKFYNKDLLGNTFREKSFNEFKRDNSFLAHEVYQFSNSKNRDFAEKYKTEFETSKNTDIIFHSTATELNLANNSVEVDSVSISDLSGISALVKAKIFVLACGALENPRILLASNKYYKKGIGNNTGFVGSCFMGHPGIENVAEVYKTDNKSCIDKNFTDKNYKVIFTTSSNKRSESKILRHNLSLTANNNFFNRKFSFFNLKCGINKKKIPQSWNLAVALEQPPRMTNNLKLHDTKDALGMPKIDIFWDSMSKIEKDTVLESVKIMARELGILGTGKIKFKKEFLNGKSHIFDDPITHHIGTTRMSDNPQTGVVDKNCKVFGLSNLYISSSSVFTTSSIAHPTYTIIALSLRLGKYLKNIKL